MFSGVFSSLFSRKRAANDMLAVRHIIVVNDRLTIEVKCSCNYFNCIIKCDEMIIQYNGCAVEFMRNQDASAIIQLTVRTKSRQIIDEYVKANGAHLKSSIINQDRLDAMSKVNQLNLDESDKRWTEIVLYTMFNELSIEESIFALSEFKNKITNKTTLPSDMVNLFVDTVKHMEDLRADLKEINQIVAEVAK